MQRNFNFCHSSTRNAIECAFGKLKKQWQIFGFSQLPSLLLTLLTLRTLPSSYLSIYIGSLQPKFPPGILAEYVFACAALHNITIDHDGGGAERNSPEDYDVSDFAGDGYQPSDDDDPLNADRTKRTRMTRISMRRLRGSNCVSSSRKDSFSGGQLFNE